MYTVEMTRMARKAYVKLPEKMRTVMYAKLIELAASPFEAHLSIKPLKGTLDFYRLRVGDWRIIYRLERETWVLQIIKIAHRKEVYR
jgi:mRNA interferase RelE/StbE